MERPGGRIFLLIVMEQPYDRHMDDRAIFHAKLAGRVLFAPARQTLAKARTAVSERNGPSARAVHEFRKSMKRWRALLRLLEPLIGAEAKQLRIEARDAARSLAHARDGQACLDALDDLAKAGSDLPRMAEQAIRRQIQSMRRKAEAGIADKPARTRLVATVDKAAAAIERWTHEAFAFDDVAEQLVESYYRARKARPGDWEKAEPESLHELRRRVVVHRYQMEVIQPLCPKFGKNWIARAQNLRQRLGKCQDLEVLLKHTAPGASLSPWSDVLKAPIEQRLRKHRLAAGRLSDRLLSDKRKAFRRRLKAACRATKRKALTSL